MILNDEQISLNSKYIHGWSYIKFSIPANGICHFNGYSSFDNKPGYSPIGILQYSTGFSMIVVVVLTTLNQNTGIELRNIGNTAYTDAMLSCYVLYEKS